MARFTTTVPSRSTAARGPFIARAVDAGLEASVIGSFTRIGYHVRRRLYHWPPPERYDLSGRNAIVTGATSGLGLETARTLARLGASVCIVGRDAERTEAVRQRLGRETGATIESGLADLSLLQATGSFAKEYAAGHDRLDILVHNAGSLLHERTLTTEGNETTVSTHVLSPFLMTSLLVPLLEAAPTAGRVILVASGGMYSERLDVAGLQMPDGYDGVKAYARAKRAQVTLAREWSRRLLDRPVAVNAMHPGWCDTPGIRDALPRFSRAIGPLLRTAAEGIDTSVWLGAAPEAAQIHGRFLLDRRPRATHKAPWTRRPDEELEAERLWRWCAEATGAPPI
ncbi:MAG: dehydrogenase/reductase family er 12 [Gaiellaceae bacterium]|nr:dehydrogenase/reductase family er 12 [Gaiellaceae bacterium]